MNFNLFTELEFDDEDFDDGRDLSELGIDFDIEDSELYETLCEYIDADHSNAGYIDHLEWKLNGLIMKNLCEGKLTADQALHLRRLTYPPAE